MGILGILAAAFLLIPASVEQKVINNFIPQQDPSQKEYEEKEKECKEYLLNNMEDTETLFYRLRVFDRLANYLLSVLGNMNQNTESFKEMTVQAIDNKVIDLNDYLENFDNTNPYKDYYIALARLKAFCFQARDKIISLLSPQDVEQFRQVFHQNLSGIKEAVEEEMNDECYFSFRKEI